MRLRFLYFILALTCSAVLKAQFYGTIIDAGTGEPVPYAIVQYEGTSIGQQSDADGKFQVGIYKEHNKLKVLCIGYKTVVVTVNASQTEIHSIIKLYSDDILLSEVEIKSVRIYSRSLSDDEELDNKIQPEK